MPNAFYDLSRTRKLGKSPPIHAILTHRIANINYPPHGDTHVCAMNTGKAKSN
ncbi:MAG: hypothetical protein JWR19_4111 [Pedosphaera sp.]|nr:hypothetical protein [Pedosphaera sp.]